MSLYNDLTDVLTPYANKIKEVNESLNDLDAETRLDMLVTMQEVIPDEDAPEDTTVQLLDPVAFPITKVGNNYKIDNPRIPYVGDGFYYPNPYQPSSTDPSAKTLYYAKFYDAYGNALTLKKYDDPETTVSSVTLFNAYNSYIKIEDKRIISSYVRGQRNIRCIVDADIAYFGGSGSFFGYPSSATDYCGVTYGGYSTTYVSYEGSSQETTYEYNYTTELAEFVQDYISTHERYSNDFYKFTYPDTDKSLSVNAFRYFHERAKRENDGVIRVASFNKFVSRQSANWETIKKELSDFAVDICGFQEAVNLLSSSGKRIEEFMLGYQFVDGSDFSYSTYNFNNGDGPGKAIVSHWMVDSTDVFTLATSDDSTTHCALRCKITIPSGKWFSRYVESDCTLSVYSWHGMSRNANVDGVRKTSLEIRQMEITALLAIMEQDTSDFKIVVADTNCFAAGLDVQTNTHVEWEMFRTAGYAPVLPGIESTVTADLAASFFHIDGNNVAFCDACYDQIFISSNITAEGYKVIDSNLYPVESLEGVPVSDHCMIYADLKLDFDAVMQEKIKAALNEN